MILSDLDANWLYLCLDEFQRHRRSHGEPIPDPVRRLFWRLRREVVEHVPDSEGVANEPGASDDIGSREAAAVLACSEQWVRRLAADLDGHRVGHSWVFSRRAVEAYAAARGAA